MDASLLLLYHVRQGGFFLSCALLFFFLFFSFFVSCFCRCEPECEVGWDGLGCFFDLIALYLLVSTCMMPP